ncbi:MAG: T9SS type A sorting domain-containing protein, partial [Bacteroidota bacterium]
GQMQWFAQRADRILLHAYRTNDVDVYSYSRTRLSDAASINSSVKIIPIFSSESAFMGPWLSTHPITLPYVTYSLGLTAELSSWKQYISLQGYHWFKYTTMPATTTVAASVSAGGPTTFCTGGNVVLTANSGTGQTYQWTKNASNISGATSISYTASTSGAFAVKVTKSGTTATSASIAVTVSSTITAPTINASGPVSFCPGGSVVLSSSSSTGNHWSNNATTQSITVSTAGSYSVTVTLGTCSATSTPTVVSTTTTPVTPSITASGSTSLCPGIGITLASSATTSGTYVWSTGESTRSIAVKAAGTYWVRTGTTTCYSQSPNKVITMLTAPSTPTISANGSTNIGSSGSVTLTSTSASAYSWIDGTSTRSIVANTAGNYRVTVTGTNGCKSTSAPKLVTSSTCTPPAVPTISSSSTTNILVNGFNITLTASNTTGGWLWSNGATTRAITVTTAGTYSVKAFSSGNCYSISLPVTVLLIYRFREAGVSDVNNNLSDLVAFPNPSNGQFQVSFTCEKEQTCMVNIYDLSGRMVMEKNISAVTGNNLVEMNSTSLTSGMYLMRLSGDGINAQLRLSITE